MEHRKINHAWFQTTCPLCRHEYRWHRERRNQCPKCKADYGYLVTMAEIEQRFRDYNEQGQATDEHYAGSAKCRVCSYRWVAVAPIICEDLECPNCHNFSGEFDD